MSERWDLRLGRWQDVLADVECDALICDPPYSERTHTGHGDPRTMTWARNNGDVDKPSKRRAITYSPWSEDEMHAFVRAMSPRCRGWFVAIVDHIQARWIEDALAACGRYVFAPLPCVEVGRTVRLGGDGPSSWTSWMVAARPRERRFQKWGTLPGAYQVGGDTGHNRRHRRIGGKPLDMMKAIVRDYSRPGDLICDPTAGLATTGVAALTMGRRFVGAECDPETYTRAECRLGETQYVDLFDAGRATQESLL